MQPVPWREGALDDDDDDDAEDAFVPAPDVAASMFLADWLNAAIGPHGSAASARAYEERLAVVLAHLAPRELASAGAFVTYGQVPALVCWESALLGV